MDRTPTYVKDVMIERNSSILNSDSFVTLSMMIDISELSSNIMISIKPDGHLVKLLQNVDSVVFVTNNS